MQFIDYLREQKGYSRYITTERWCTGGTLGTCWDVDGPTELSEDPPIDLLTCYEFLQVFKDFKLDDEPSKYEFCACVEEYSDSDYYGGTAFYCHYIISVNDILEHFYRTNYNITNYSLDYVKKHYPELFI